MGKTTGISWTDGTWNPWHGCVKISPGCQYCYMYRDKQRYGQDPTQVVRSQTTFEGPLKWKAPTRVFTCSWSDFFLPAADAWRPAAWEVIRRTPQHTYMILTKRIDRVADHLPDGWPWAHVWLGVSVESGPYVWRIDRLREVPAAVRFLSCEPLLSPITPLDLRGIGWVIVGCESGPQRRPMDGTWARRIYGQCAHAGAAFWMKQMDVGGRVTEELSQFPEDLRVRQLPYVYAKQEELF